VRHCRSWYVWVIVHRRSRMLPQRVVIMMPMAASYRTNHGSYPAIDPTRPQIIRCATQAREKK
jgi:hypothetical protein